MQAQFHTQVYKQERVLVSPWVDGNPVGLGCFRFRMNGVFAGNITTNMCKKANSKAHLEKQLRFMMSAKVQNYVASILGVSLDSYSWWIGAELKYGRWHWTHSNVPMKY